LTSALSMRITIRTKPRTSAGDPSTIAVEPLRIGVKSRPMRVLDFDVEARPLHWISGDYVSKEITAIAWAWCDAPEHVTCYLLGETAPITMLQAFCEAYQQADMVTGHFIRGYDLPMINGALTEYQLPTLPDKLSQDTKIDLVRRQGLSGSQENLGVMLGLEREKVKMDQRSWRDANRLTPEGLEKTRKRVVGDVQQHIEMRKRLLDLGYLAAPVMWRGGTAPVETYTP
jgi:hypothetical protein